MQTPVIQTPRLTLRPLSEADVPAIQKEFPCWEIVRYTRAIVPWPYPPDGAQHFWENVLSPKIEKGEAIGLGLIPKETQSELIGLIHFEKEEKGWTRGFWIAPRYHRQGLMTEATIHANDYFFCELKMDSLQIETAHGNIASNRIKEKTGFHLIEITEGWAGHGGFTHTEHWKITREDWMNVRKKLLAPYIKD